MSPQAPLRLRASGLASAITLALVSACSSSSHPAGPPTDAAVDVGGPGDSGDGLDDPPIDPRFAEFAKAFDEERAALGAPGAAVALIEHGEVTFAHGFGTKGPSSADKVRARTLFRVGSTTKVLTATLLLQQVAAGKLDLAAKVKAYAPDLAIDGSELEELTPKHLLTHASGLRDYLELSSTKALLGDDALSKYLTGSAFRGQEYFMDPPGTMWNYSNPNFYVAALLAERASGRPYGALLSERLLRPLGMTRTFLLPSEVVADGDYANGKSTDASGAPWDVSPSSYDNGWGRPAGYAFSSVVDFAKFVRFLHAGDDAVLPAAQRVELTKPQIDTLQYGHQERYGYATFVYDGLTVGKGDYRAATVVTHGGDISGFAADFWLIPSTGAGAVVYANADGAHFTSSLALALKTFGGLPAPSTPPDVSVDPTTFDALAGDYLDIHNVGEIHVARSGGELTISMPDVDAAGVPYEPKLTPVAPDAFVLAIQGRQLLVTFIRDAAGAPAWLRTRVFVGRRTPTSASASAPAAFAPVDRRALTRALRDAGPLPLPLRLRLAP